MILKQYTVHMFKLYVVVSKQTIFDDLFKHIIFVRFMHAPLYGSSMWIRFLQLHSILVYEHITICLLPADTHLGDFYFSN